MSFSWSELLQDAKHLLIPYKTGQVHEHTSRTIINRCYWAAFMHSRTALLKKGYSIDAIWVHPGGNKKLSKILEGHHEAIVRVLGDVDSNLGQSLENLRRKRVASDYVDSIPSHYLMVSELNSILKKAENICQF